MRNRAILSASAEKPLNHRKWWKLSRAVSVSWRPRSRHVATPPPPVSTSDCGRPFTSFRSGGARWHRKSSTASSRPARERPKLLDRLDAESPLLRLRRERPGKDLWRLREQPARGGQKCASGASWGRGLRARERRRHLRRGTGSERSGDQRSRRQRWPRRGVQFIPRASTKTCPGKKSEETTSIWRCRRFACDPGSQRSGQPLVLHPRHSGREAGLLAACCLRPDIW
jgi:hypothetical protein